MTEKKQQGLQFPCEFPIKIFGVASEQFVPAIMAIIHRHAPGLHESAVNSRPSKDGKYLALTITVTVENQKELDAIYQELTNSPFVLMAL